MTESEPPLQKELPPKPPYAVLIFAPWPFRFGPTSKVAVRFVYHLLVGIQTGVASKNLVREWNTLGQVEAAPPPELILLGLASILSGIALLMSLIKNRGWFLVSLASSIMLLAVSNRFAYSFGTPLQCLLFALWTKSIESDRSQA